MENHDIEINIGEFLYYLLSKWWIILLSVVLGGSLMLVYTQFMTTPMYRSTAKLYVVSQGENKTNSDVQMMINLASDFEEMSTGRDVYNAVIKELGLDLTYEDMKEKVSSSNSSGSSIITISVSDEDPVMAQSIASLICVKAESHLADMVDNDFVNICEYANLPTKPYSPSVFKNVAIGILVGLVLSIGVFFAIFVIDDKIKTPADIEKYLELSTIGVIPPCKTDEVRRR